jgi:hypothetical protein
MWLWSKNTKKIEGDRRFHTGTDLPGDKRATDMVMHGIESTGNSSTDALTSGSTFTGTGEQNNCAHVGVMLKTDQPGTLYFQFSSDGTNWDSQFPVNGYRVKANIPIFHTAVKLGRYFRTVYVNDSDGDQTFFRMKIYYGDSFVPSVITLEQSVAPDADTTLVRPVTDVDLELARRQITGQEARFIFGHTKTLVNGTWSDVWAGAGNYPWQQVGAKIKVKSSSTADTVGGLGLQSVEIHGLSSLDGSDQEEIINLNGTTPVESALSYSRVTLAHNQEVGTYGGSHQGDIELRVTNATFANGALIGKMEGKEGAADSSVQYGYGEANNGFLSVPKGLVAYITRLEVIPNAAKPIDIVLYEREGILLQNPPYLPRREIWGADAVDVPIEKVFKSHIKIKSLTDLWFRAQGNGQSSEVDVWLDYYLLTNKADNG